uniref:Uncharacterized protein n=1 Tax=Anguilla anguilla TaxID=7936 RepID=A0A0E9SWT7_ANGAN
MLAMPCCSAAQAHQSEQVFSNSVFGR